MEKSHYKYKLKQEVKKLHSQHLLPSSNIYLIFRARDVRMFTFLVSFLFYCSWVSSEFLERCFSYVTSVLPLAFTFRIFFYNFVVQLIRSPSLPLLAFVCSYFFFSRFIILTSILQAFSRILCVCVCVT